MRKMAGTARAFPGGASCFGGTHLSDTPDGPVTLGLTNPHARALGELLPVLLCGEESAVLAFAHHAQSERWGPRARQDFARIESDEARHTRWLLRLRASLPRPRTDIQTYRGLKHFFISLSSPDFGIHLGHIAALDSAVCLILGRLRRTSACAADARVRTVFELIHRDEACHVAIARHYAGELCETRGLMACATEMRERLTTLLASHAKAFETLEVCPDDLFKQLRTPPQRLFK